MTTLVFAGPVDNCEDGDDGQHDPLTPGCFTIGGVHVIRRVLARIDNGAGVVIGTRAPGGKWATSVGHLQAHTGGLEQPAPPPDAPDDAPPPTMRGAQLAVGTTDWLDKLTEAGPGEVEWLIADEQVDFGATLPAPESSDEPDVEIATVVGPNLVRGVVVPGWHRITTDTNRPHRPPDPKLPCDLLEGERLVVIGPPHLRGLVAFELDDRDDRPYDLRARRDWTVEERQDALAEIISDERKAEDTEVPDEIALMLAHLHLRHDLQLAWCLEASPDEAIAEHAEAVHNDHRHHEWAAGPPDDETEA